METFVLKDEKYQKITSSLSNFSDSYKYSTVGDWRRNTLSLKTSLNYVDGTTAWSTTSTYNVWQRGLNITKKDISYTWSNNNNTWFNAYDRMTGYSLSTPNSKSGTLKTSYCYVFCDPNPGSVTNGISGDIGVYLTSKNSQLMVDGNKAHILSNHTVAPDCYYGSEISYVVLHAYLENFKYTYSYKNSSPRSGYLTLTESINNSLNQNLWSSSYKYWIWQNGTNYIQPSGKISYNIKKSNSSSSQISILNQGSVAYCAFNNSNKASYTSTKTLTNGVFKYGNGLELSQITHDGVSKYDYYIYYDDVQSGSYIVTKTDNKIVYCNIYAYMDSTKVWKSNTIHYHLIQSGEDLGLTSSYRFFMENNSGNSWYTFSQGSNYAILSIKARTRPTQSVTSLKLNPTTSSTVSSIGGTLTVSMTKSSEINTSGSSTAFAGTLSCEHILGLKSDYDYATWYSLNNIMASTNDGFYTLASSIGSLPIIVNGLAASSPASSTFSIVDSSNAQYATFTVSNYTNNSTQYVNITIPSAPISSDTPGTTNYSNVKFVNLNWDSNSSESKTLYCYNYSQTVGEGGSAPAQTFNFTVKCTSGLTSSQYSSETFSVVRSAQKSDSILSAPQVTGSIKTSPEWFNVTSGVVIYSSDSSKSTVPVGSATATGITITPSSTNIKSFSYTWSSIIQLNGVGGSNSSGTLPAPNPSGVTGTSAITKEISIYVGSNTTPTKVQCVHNATTTPKYNLTVINQSFGLNLTLTEPSDGSPETNYHYLSSKYSISYTPPINTFQITSLEKPWLNITAGSSFSTKTWDGNTHYWRIMSLVTGISTDKVYNGYLKLTVKPYENTCTSNTQFTLTNIKVKGTAAQYNSNYSASSVTVSNSNSSVFTLLSKDYVYSVTSSTVDGDGNTGAHTTSTQYITCVISATGSPTSTVSTNVTMSIGGLTTSTITLTINPPTWTPHIEKA